MILFRILILYVLLVPFIGCDAAAVGVQRVAVTVLDSESGDPVRNAEVVCAPAERLGPERFLSESEYIAQFAGGSSVTNEVGTVGLIIHTRTMHGGIDVWLGFRPVRLEDEVTGKSYLFQISGASKDTEILSVPMVQRSHAQGHLYKVLVTFIGRPLPRGEAANNTDIAEGKPRGRD